MTYRFGLDAPSKATLEAYLQPDVNDTDDHGWEEVCDAGLTHLLKTSLAKNPKPADAVSASSNGFPTDTSKLKRHLSMVCDRLQKGGKVLYESGSAAEGASGKGSVGVDGGQQ